MSVQVFRPPVPMLDYAIDMPASPLAAAKAFFAAMAHSDLATINLLLSSGSVDVNCANYLHKTPLFVATETGNLTLARLLVEHGADANLLSYCSNYSVYELPVVTAVRMRSRDIIELLLACGGRQAGGDSKTALQWAATHGDMAIAELLIRHGADINAIGPYFNTALHYATTAERVDMVAWLLHHGAELSVNNDGRSALHIAAVRGSLQIVRHLIGAGCEVDIRDDFKFTPFSLACLRGHFDVLQYLVENSAGGACFNFDDGLLKAAECGHVSIMKYLLRRGANVNCVNSTGESALSLAAKGQPIAVNMLLQAGAVVDVVDVRGYTPLQVALLREHVDIATTLLRHGAWPRPALMASESPLHMAFTCSRPLLLKMLLLAGCSAESWLNTAAVAQKLNEVDFQTPRLPSRQACMQKDAWRWAISFTRRPRSLLQSCRISVRRSLSAATRGSSIECTINALPLPPRMKRYIALCEVFLE